MGGNSKICYRTEFPRIGRALFVRCTTGEVATVSVTNGSTGEIISSKRFEDYNDAMNYYSGQFNNLKSAEEYATMMAAFKMFGLM